MAIFDLHTQKAKGEALASEEYIVKAMPNILGTWDMIATYLVAVFFIVNAATAAAGGAAAFTYLLLGAVAFFVPCAIATAQLGHMYPHEGSLYNWTHKALGGFWSFFVGFCGWFPGVLVIVAGADITVSFIQGLNSNWLVEPWQQGLAIIAIIICSSALAMQRFRVVQNVVNLVIVLILLAVVLIGTAGAGWLLTGHHSATDFTQLSNWTINWGSQGNINLFGLITLAYLGTEVPLNMGGEITKRSVVTRHILWGTVLVLIGYFVATASLLIVQGSAAGTVGGFSLVQTVDTVLGKLAGNIVVIAILSFFFIVPVVYNYNFARILLVGAIDQRLPVSFGKLNKNRVPAYAILVQTMIAIAFIIIVFMIAPYITNLGKPADLALVVYNVAQASATLVWAIATAFLFINIAIFYRRDPEGFNRQRIFPAPVLLASVVLGPIACLAAIIDSLFFSWIPQISNANWWYIIGSLTLSYLIVATIGSIFATGEAAWEDLEQGM